jgi:hydroxymethylbilane synthase
VDLAVHSIKDLPTELPSGLALAAIPQREDPHDCLLSRSGAHLADLPAGARLGTSSVRRQAQLRRARRDLQFSELRGNVDTRFRKLERGDYDAIVLAKAGLSRLGLSGKITETLSTDVCLPAVGQGALGIETRDEDAGVNRLVAALDHTESRICVTAERKLLDAMQGGCQMPLGAWARIDGGKLRLEACLISADGTDYIRQKAEGSTNAALDVAESVARALFEAGAERILKLAGRNVAGS